MKSLTEFIQESIEQGNINEAKEPNAYVVVDMSDESVLGNYDLKHDKDALDNAIADADEMHDKNKRGSYWVVACFDDEYDLDDEESVVHKAE